MKLILLLLLALTSCTVREIPVIQNDWGIITSIKTVSKNRYEVTVKSSKDIEFIFYTSITHNINDTIKIQ